MMDFKKHCFIVVLSASFVCCSQCDSAPLSTRVTNEIEHILRAHADLSIGVEIYSFKNNQIVYARNEFQRLVPASNTKIVTALLALEYLGENYQFVTQVLSDSEVQKGVLHGDIYLRGSGDPSLRSADVEELIKALNVRGITRIEGDFCIDCEEFDHECFAAGVAIDNLGESWFNPVGALIVDHKALQLYPVNIVSFTDSEKLKGMFFDGVNFLDGLLKKYDIIVTGTFIFKRCQDSTVLVEHASEKLSVLLQHAMKQSDNLYADCLFKKLGAVCYGIPGTWQKGVALLGDFLTTKLALKSDDMKLSDGSGLSRYNLISAHQLVNILTWAHAQPYSKDFVESLSIAGVDGTLKNRMKNVASKIKAKTGTMGGISALSGFIEAEDDVLAFAILINGYISSSMYTPPCKREIEDAICLLLAGVA